MPLFACSECETIENTALGDFCRREDGKGDLIRLQGKPACAWAPVEGS